MKMVWGKNKKESFVVPTGAKEYDHKEAEDCGEFSPCKLLPRCLWQGEDYPDLSRANDQCCAKRVPSEQIMMEMRGTNPSRI